jgi:hypothetical protein
MLFRSSRAGTLVLTTVALAGCGDLGPGSEANIEVTMQQSDAALASAPEGWLGSTRSAGDASGNISRDTVAALVVRISSVQFLPTTGDSASDAAWVSLDLASPVVLDLLDLPTEGASPLVIASGAVPVGEYGKVRLFVDSAAIEFKGPINIGAAVSFAAGVAHQVDIPSAAQTGLKTDIAFTVEEGADVNLLFDPSTTFTNVTATGSGRVILTPVIRSRPQ